MNTHRAPTRKLILDGDYGIDDSLAALFLAHRPDVDIVAVGSVHGNATADAAARNALAVLDIGGRPTVPVAVGARRPIAQPLDTAALVHGVDGLGGHAPPPPAGSKLVPAPAAVQIVDTVRANPGQCTIVATGPFTNLALALLLDPELPSLVEHVVLMGGAVEHPGNITPYAESNVFHDPEAADLVLTGGWPVTLVGLDVTMSTWLEDAELRRIEGDNTRSGRFAWRILQHYLGFYAERYGRRSCPMHDPSAALVAVDPSLATSWTDAAVRVELRSPETRGMLLVDRRASAPVRNTDLPSVRVLTGIDRSRLVPTFLDVLLSGPS